MGGSLGLSVPPDSFGRELRVSDSVSLLLGVGELCGRDVSTQGLGGAFGRATAS